MIDNNKVEYLCRLIDRLDDCDKYTDACDEAIEVIGQYIKILEQPASPGWKEFRTYLFKKMQEEIDECTEDDDGEYEGCLRVARSFIATIPPPQPIACEDETDSQHISCEEKLLQFYEPHPTGGDARVRISAEKAIDSQKGSASKRGHEYKSDKAALDDFIVCHHAHYITTDTEEASE